MKNYLIEKILDNDGNVTDYKLKYKTSSRAFPRGKNYLILEGEDFKFPKIEVVDGEPQIVEDSDAKSQAETKKLQLKNSETEAKKVSNRLKDHLRDMDSYSTIEDIKPVLKVILKVLIYLVRKSED